jgi:tetratricopeptide (TPR) repeat protein
VRLVDNESLRHLWSERYQGDWDELASFQEEAAKALVAAIPVQVEQAELERVRHRPIHSLTAYENCLRGRGYQRSATYTSHAQAMECFSRALEQDSNLAAAHRGMAVCHTSSGGITPGEEATRRERAISFALKAIELDPLDAHGHSLLGMFLQMKRDFAGARSHLDRAVMLSPGDVEALGVTGLEYAYAGEVERGIEQAERAIRLNPCYPPIAVEHMGKSCLIGHRYEEALFWLRQAPDRITTNRGWLAAAAAYAGRMDEAAFHARLMQTTLLQRLGVDQLREIGGPIAWLRQPARFQNAADLDHYVRGLELAGLESFG